MIGPKYEGNSANQNYCKEQEVGCLQDPYQTASIANNRKMPASLRAVNRKTSRALKKNPRKDNYQLQLNTEECCEKGKGDREERCKRGIKKREHNLGTRTKHKTSKLTRRNQHLVNKSINLYNRCRNPILSFQHDTDSMMRGDNGTEKVQPRSLDVIPSNGISRIHSEIMMGWECQTILKLLSKNQPNSRRAIGKFDQLQSHVRVQKNPQSNRSRLQFTYIHDQYP